MNPSNKTNLISSNKGLAIVYLFLAIFMIASALLELRQSKNELLQLMESQAHSLLESLLIASGNILRADNQLSKVFEKNALDRATILKSLYESGNLTPQNLNQFARAEDIHLINIYNQNGKLILSNQSGSSMNAPINNNPDLLFPVFSGYQDTLILGLHKANNGQDYHYSLALAIQNGLVLFLDLNANHLVSARHQSSFGQLIRNIASGNKNIIYAALQDTSSILAASGNVSQLSSIHQDDFLFRAYRDSLFLTQVSDFDSIQVFEAIHPFVYEGANLGLFRLGISLEPLDDINNRIIRRLAIITIILIIIGSIFFTYIFIRQRYHLLQKEYSVVETYSGNIIENVSDAIIVANETDGIRIFNHAAENIFDQKREQVHGKSLSILLNDQFRQALDSKNEPVNQIEWNLNGKIRYFLISHNSFTDIDGVPNIIILCRDMTQIRVLESQIQRKARLSAMGELAAGVAHEIRNPLNTIGTIAQQLYRDFEPKDGLSEYSELNQLVMEEVRRINKTIQGFLAFTKPDPANPQSFIFSDWLTSIELQFKNMLAEKDINLQIKNEYSGQVRWDKDHMRQVMLNLIQNAIDALESGGSIHLKARETGNNTLLIIIEDNGPGIPAEVQDKVFNIYFSTKQNGTGIGLSIVQRIIQDHDGSIQIENKTGTGTKMVIEVPVNLTSG